MSKGHNKKRNVGLVYEQIVRQASIATTDKKVADAKKYIGLAKKYFSNDSELVKEFKLFNAILETNNVSERVACRVLTKPTAYLVEVSFLIHMLKILGH